MHRAQKSSVYNIQKQWRKQESKILTYLIKILRQKHSLELLRGGHVSVCVYIIYLYGISRDVLVAATPKCSPTGCCVRLYKFIFFTYFVIYITNTPQFNYRMCGYWVLHASSNAPLSTWHAQTIRNYTAATTNNNKTAILSVIIFLLWWWDILLHLTILFNKYTEPSRNV